MSESEKAKAQLVIVTGMVVLYFIFKSNYFLYAGAAVGVLSIGIPVAGDVIVKCWYKIAEVLGAINGKILLSIVFFIVLFPVAVLARLRKRDDLGLKDSEASVFKDRNHKYAAKDLEQVW